MHRYARILLVLIAAFAFGCASKEASYHYTQKQIAHAMATGSAEVLTFDQHLRVDEYINAFPQDELPGPAAGEALGLSMAWLQPAVAKGAERSLVQIAVKSRAPTKGEKRATLGLVFVLDVSGSMDSDNKMADSIEALKNAVMELPEGTWFSLVTFNGGAHVELQPQQVTARNRRNIVGAIAQIGPGGGTDIQSGLVKGYEQLAKLPPDVLSRLVLLTDGQSTVGTTDPRGIAKEAGVGYLEGARISTIGLGIDVDQQLLRKIAEEGQGAFYFADTAKTLTKYLREELRGLVIPVAKDVQLKLATTEGFRIRTVYGFEDAPRDEDGTLTIDFGELNVDDWRIVIAEVEGSASGNVTPVHAHLAYAGLDGAAAPLLAANEPVSWGAENATGKPLNQAVARNAVVFANAMALREASRLLHEGKPGEALDLISVQLANTQVALEWDQTDSMQREMETLSNVREILLGTRGVDPGRVSAQADVPLAETDPDAEMRRKMLRLAFRLGEQLAPGPWGILVGVFGDIYLSYDAAEPGTREGQVGGTL